MLKRYTVFSFRQHLKVFQSKKQLIPKDFVTLQSYPFMWP